MKLKWIIAGIVLGGALSSLADALLFDFNQISGTANDGSVADFLALGVTEDLTGAQLLQVTASTDSDMTFGGFTLSYLSGIAQSVNSYTPQDNGVLADYLYLEDGSNGGPVDMRLLGLGGFLATNTTYSLYMISAGDVPGQGSDFIFNGVTNIASGAVAKFSFSTGAAVTNSLDFTWSRNGSSTYGAFNGIAIAAVPEPSTIGLFGICGVALFMWRRNMASKKSATDQK